MSVFRVLRRGERRYSPVAYLFGALLPGRRSGSGPVAWLRGLPMPDVRPGRGRIALGHVALYPGVKLHCRGNGLIEVGDGSFLNRNTRVYAGREVRIGARCMVSWDCIVTDWSGFDAAEPCAPVFLGDNVWVGARVVILGGTRLGDGCVVAAGSVIQGEYPAGTIVSGKPAEVVA